MCTRCGQTKPRDEFHRSSASADGLLARCKACRAEVHQQRAPKVREYRRRHRSEHGERLRTESAQYFRVNKHKQWESEYRRRCRLYGLPIVIVSFTRGEVVSKYGNACVECGSPEWELDHDVPVAAGGPHTIENVRPRCHPCNARKARVRDDLLISAVRNGD
ncbi:endonuclease VII [Gordonia phage Gsput1]|uniref:HNH endonuclease n=1 Tax=Gordonia phage Gsput1 TaxID=1622193 RepID=A0A0E3XA05_9CAUD|nr:endonuclease VII [Gordonia phage Gsput1]AKC03077.1 HNH endonuclease [Gordonia phage Gsput1]